MLTALGGRFFRRPSRPRSAKAPSTRGTAASPQLDPAAGGTGRKRDVGDTPDDESTCSLSADNDRPMVHGPVSAPSCQIEVRQQEEKDFIRNNDTAEAHVWYLVDVRWLQDWKLFVTRSGPVPGPLDNGRLVDSRGQPRPGLLAVQDYRGVNHAIWEYWHGRYRGGPTVRRKQLDLYTSAPDEPDTPSGSQRLDMPLPGAATPAAPVRSEAPRESGASSREEARSSHTARRTGSSGGSTAASRATSQSRRSAASARPQAAPEQPPPLPPPPGAAAAGGGGAPLCCDKCDGPHETDRCPHFKRARERHQDAWTAYGKTTGTKDSAGDGAPIVKNARVVPQPADGSCLFHSLSYGLSDRSTTASSLRRDICGYIAKNPDMKIADTAIKDWIQYDSNDSVQMYAQRMAGGTWGGGIEMAALTRMRAVNVHVYERCREGYRRISAFDCPNARKTICVLYQGRMHYDAIEL